MARRFKERRMRFSLTLVIMAAAVLAVCIACMLCARDQERAVQIMAGPAVFSALALALFCLVLLKCRKDVRKSRKSRGSTRIGRPAYR
jgi:uncharacterized membrane protein YqjE